MFINRGKLGMPKISVIVPVFNCEKFLHKCVNSVLSQTFSDFEIIMINDGSTDKSPAICDEYAKADNRVLVIHKENGGVASARNAGIRKAGGQYIAFVDGDDYCYPDCLKTYVENIEAYNADLTIAQWVTERKTYSLKKADGQIEILKRADCFNRMVEFSYSLWNKFFRHDIIVKNNIHFDETLQHTEDFPFVCEYLQYIDRAVYIHKHVYCYRINPNSITSNPSLEKNLSTLKLIEFLDDIYSRNAPEYIYICHEICRVIYEEVGNSYRMANKKIQKKAYLKKSKARLKKVLLNKSAPLKFKIRSFLLSIRFVNKIKNYPNLLKIKRKISNN